MPAFKIPPGYFVLDADLFWQRRLIFDIASASYIEIAGGME